MPTYRQDPTAGYTRSQHQLGRKMLHNPLRSFLNDLAVRDRVTLFNDFKDRNEINNWTTAQTQTSTNFTVTTDVVGTLIATTAAVTTASVSMVGKEPWAGNNNVTLEGRFKINTVASTFIVEFGLVDAAPATGASFVTDIDVPSFAGTNGAVWGIWNNQTHTSMAFASVGSFTSQTVASYLVTAASSGFTTPAADTYLTIKLQLLTDPDETGKTKVYGWINGVLLAKLDNRAAGFVNGQSNLFPWFYVQSVAASAKVPTVDYIRIAQDRAALSAALEGQVT